MGNIDWSDLKKRLAGERIVLGIGVFDGVHLGHRKLLHELVEMAKTQNAAPVALTFVPHPRLVLTPDKPPTLLMPENRRIEALRQYGAEAVAVAQFDRELAALTPEAFLRQLTQENPWTIKGICVGSAWRFGVSGSGTAAMVAQFCEQQNWNFCGVPELRVGGQLVSSSAIRQALYEGRLASAEQLLGRHYQWFGVVEHGVGFATDGLACPTANLHLSAGVLVPDGVYAAQAALDGEAFLAAVNVGVAPTFNWQQFKERRIEVHLLDFAGDLYGRDLTVTLLKHLRCERTFGNAEELKKQIAMDIENIKNSYKN